MSEPGGPHRLGATRARWTLRDEGTRPERRGPVSLHSVAGHLAAVIHISGRAWCALTPGDRGGHVIAFVEGADR